MMEELVHDVVVGDVTSYKFRVKGCNVGEHLSGLAEGNTRQLCLRRGKEQITTLFFDSFQPHFLLPSPGSESAGFIV